MEILIGLIIVTVVVFISQFNGLIALKEAVFTDEKGIGIQLDERNKLFDSLINTVNKYMDHEKGTFAEIVKLRNIAKSNSLSASTDSSTHAAEEELSTLIASGAISSGINMTMEAYPELKSSNNMLQLQESIENIERKLANSKKAFNSSIEDYNSKAESIPGVFIVALFPSMLKFTFIRWELSSEKIQQAEEKIVSF
jgi:LemA protein